MYVCMNLMRPCSVWSCLKKSPNVSKPREHLPDRGENVKTFGWEHRLCVVLCVVIPFILDVRLVDVAAGVTQDFSTFLLRAKTNNLLLPSQTYFLILLFYNPP